MSSKCYDWYIVGLLETLNERLDMFEKVHAMGEFCKDGRTNIDLLMMDGDFVVPVIHLDFLEKNDLPLLEIWEDLVE